MRKEESRDAMAHALVDRWSMTGSFHSASEDYGFLRKIPKEAWARALVERVCKAREQNVQLRDASINWQSSDVALHNLFVGLDNGCPEPVGSEDDIPF